MIDQLQGYKIFENEEILECTLLKNQGYCNTNYLLQTKNKKYLIRKFKLSTPDREFEFKVQKAAYKSNLAAKPLLLDKLNDLMICEFLDGYHKVKLSKENLKKIALLLRKLHKVKIRQKPSNVNNFFTSKSKEVKQALASLEKYSTEYVLCHNDLNPQNILFSNTVKFIDWEYASINDRYFDLASVCIEFNLNKKDEVYFLKNYFSNADTINKDKLNTYKIVYSALCLQWFDKLASDQL